MKSLQEILEEMVENDQAKSSNKEKETEIEQGVREVQRLTEIIAIDISPESAHVLGSSALTAIAFQHHAMLQEVRKAMDYIMLELLNDEYSEAISHTAKDLGTGERAAALFLLTDLGKKQAGLSVALAVIVDSLKKLRDIDCSYEMPNKEMILAEIKETSRKTEEQMKELARNGSNSE